MVFYFSPYIHFDVQYISTDNKTIRHVPPRHELGASSRVHVLRAMGYAASHTTGADPSEGQDLRANAVERHSLYARALCDA